MNKGMKEYLDRKGAKPLDERILKEFKKGMIERTIPEIQKEFKENAQRAAEIRFSPRRRRNVDK